MPLLLTQTIEDVRCAVWRVTEPCDVLAGITGADDAAHATAGLSSPKRVTERLAARALLRMAFPGDYDRIVYDGHGRPMLAHGRAQVSISHTDGYVAVALSDRRIGVDIELRTGKALRLGGRFMDDGELVRVLAADDPETAATAVWSAKETVYKAVGHAAADFRAAVHVGFSTSGLSFPGFVTVSVTSLARPCRVYVAADDRFVLTLGLFVV